MDDSDARVLPALARAAQLREELAAVTRRTAEVAAHSARVHDDVAELHVALPHSRLDPDALRRHADRDVAEQERRAAADLEQD